jgi:hypothetical protein
LQFTSEDNEKILGNQEFNHSKMSRLNLLLRLMNEEINSQIEDVQVYFGNMFDPTFYRASVNKFHTTDNKDFLEYVAIILGLRDDDGTILTEMQQKFIL